MAKEQLSWSVELALQLLHETIEKTKPGSDRGVLLRRAIGQLSEHATRRLKSMPWPPSAQEPPTPIRAPLPTVIPGQDRDPA